MKFRIVEHTNNKDHTKFFTVEYKKWLLWFWKTYKAYHYPKVDGIPAYKVTKKFDNIMDARGKMWDLSKEHKKKVYISTIVEEYPKERKKYEI